MNFLFDNYDQPFLIIGYLKALHLIIKAGSYKITQISHICVGLKSLRNDMKIVWLIGRTTAQIYFDSTKR